MKKALVAIALAGLASSAFATVQGSPHDLSSNTGPWATLGGKLSACQFCHAPHNVNTGLAGTPLWNRNTITSVSYTMYTSATLKNPRANTPNPNSMTCLSCHDGVSDMGATYTGGRGFTSATTIGAVVAAYPTQGHAAANVGTNLADDHPVSVQYPTSGPNSTYYKALTSAQTDGIKFYNYTSGINFVECASCHDPHNFGDTTSTAGSTFTPFLRVAKERICTSCHSY